MFGNGSVQTVGRSFSPLFLLSPRPSLFTFTAQSALDSRDTRHLFRLLRESRQKPQKAVQPMRTEMARYSFDGQSWYPISTDSRKSTSQ